MEYLGGYLGQPQQLGLTPPHGRLGHSLPTPRVLGGGPIVFTHNEVRYVCVFVYNECMCMFVFKRVKA